MGDKRSVSDLSRAYETVAVPAGPAFAIWGLIYSWTFVFVIVQASTSLYDNILSSFTPWFCSATLMQGIWLATFTSSNPAKRSEGGDLWLWSSIALLMSTPLPFLSACESLAHVASDTVAYWVSYGITINTAWVILAAGINVNIAALAAGFKGMLLSMVAILVLALTVFLELNITGLIGSNSYNSPTAFFPVGIWALFWIFKNLNAESDHVKRITPLYGSTFVTFYKLCTLFLLCLFICLQVLVCVRKQ